MLLEARYGSADRRSLRHAVRTHLNHIVGFGDILGQEALDAGESELGGCYGRIRAAALDLRDAALTYFRDPGAPPDPIVGVETDAELERQIYGLLYDIIAYVQTAKRRLRRDLAQRFLPDTEKILESANAIVELFESRLGASFSDEEKAGVVTEAGGGVPADLSPERRAGPKKDLASRLDAFDVPPPRLTGRILVVDDDEFNRELLARHLERQGHVVEKAADGGAALEILLRERFHILIVDVMMPGMNGYQLLAAVKADPRLKDVNVIVISALDDTQSIARCIRLGAEDYLPREFEPVILQARIESCLEKRSLQAAEELYLEAVRDTARHLDEGLLEGAAYVRGLLPPRLAKAGLATDWVFIPSRALGGDVFSYLPLGGKRLAIFLLDVSGHGIGAALYSVTLMNLLKGQALVGADFAEPASVLARLNAAFQMETQNNLYFTAWYGIWDERRRILRYASAGSPPAILILPDDRVERLETLGMAVGMDLDAEYESADIAVPAGSRLFVFSDGAYESTTREGGILGLESLISIMAGEARNRRIPDLGAVVDNLRGLTANGRFDDDVSILEVSFG